MGFINADLLQKLGQICEDRAQIGEHFKKFQTKYKFSFNNDLPSNVLQKVDKINNKMPTHTSNTDQDENDEIIESFAFGQLKIFTWVLALYCYRQKLSLEEMKEENFQEIRSIFQNKSVMFIRYETMCLAYQKSKYAPDWNQEEIEKMIEIIKSKQAIGEWRQISYQLYCLTEGKYYRPFQQCREKWFNHLDPKVRKGKWTIEEDINLLSAVECLDCKWIEIYRQLGGVRTEHMIKNRYKSLMKKWKKKYEKTSPKKIVTLVLKHLKNKIKRGDLNSSMSSNEHEEVPVPKKQMKKAKPQEKKEAKEKVEDKFEKEEIYEKVGVEMESKKVEELEDEVNQSEFELGFSANFNNNWKTSYDFSPENQNQKEINAMLQREDNYLDDCKFKEERKTSDNDDEVLGQTKDKFNSQYNDFSLHDQFFDVPQFDKMEMIEPESQWLRKLEGKWQAQDFDDMFGY